MDRKMEVQITKRKSKWLLTMKGRAASLIREMRIKIALKFILLIRLTKKIKSFIIHSGKAMGK